MVKPCQLFLSLLSHRKIARILSVYWILGYPGPPAPRPLQQPNFGLRSIMRLKPNGEDPHEEEPHEENDGEVLKTRKSPHKGLLVRRGIKSMTAQHNPALVKG
jgi:hypothetical protein